MTYTEIDGDLIELAKQGHFDVIAHGCNCFCKMKKGIAPQMAEAFGCDKFDLEDSFYKGKIDKLGRIDFQALRRYNWKLPPFLKNAVTYPEYEKNEQILYVVNAYTQFGKKEYADEEETHLDYEALALCLRKINKFFPGKHIGLPKIGAGLAGGDWERIKKIIQRELINMQVTIVIYNK
jgi:O-acetyl-ADP-ribose deacetylase (regulator of RNase III)